MPENIQNLRLELHEGKLKMFKKCNYFLKQVKNKQ